MASSLNFPDSYPTIDNGKEASPPLTPSLFPELFLPTIHFPLHDENCKFIFAVYYKLSNLIDIPLSTDCQALLKWKVSSITPNIVKNCYKRVGFTKCTSKY